MEKNNKFDTFEMIHFARTFNSSELFNNQILSAEANSVM